MLLPSAGAVNWPRPSLERPAGVEWPTVSQWLALGLILAQAPPVPAGVAAALALDRRGKPREALAELPPPPEGTDPAVASRILYERARLTDEHLRDPLGAARLYGDYLVAFPQGPYARLAEDRKSYLIRNGTPAPEALAEYDDILRDFSRRPVDEMAGRMARLIEGFPAFPLRARACFWLANILRQQGDFAGAARWLGVVVHDYPGTGDERRAHIALAQDQVAQNHFAAGIAGLQRYVDSDDPLARELARAQVEGARQRRVWYWLFRGGIALTSTWLVVLLLGLWRRRARLLPLPFEARLFGPVAAVMVALSMFENRRAGVAVLIILGGGFLFAALQGAYLRAATPRGLRRLLPIVVSAGVAASLAFCAIDACGLTDLVVATITQGADR